MQYFWSTTAASVTEDEVNSAVDVTVAIKLSEGMDVEGVLVANEAALVEC